MVAGYIFRKWRYTASDFGASYWHQFGQQALLSQNRPALAIYTFLNRLLTRKAVDEYFLKTIPSHANQIEFIFPPSLDERAVRSQINEWLKNSNVHSRRLFMMAMLLPASIAVTKIWLVGANLLLTYQLFRMSASSRALSGSKTLQKLIDQRRVTWTPSEEFENKIKQISIKVQDELAKQEIDPGTSGKPNSSSSEEHKLENRPQIPVWQWDPKGDLHDDVVTEIQKVYRTPELLVNYRRARMQGFVHGGQTSKVENQA
eukprot:jgi/Hompol1/2689/HPOL_006144-RA